MGPPAAAPAGLPTAFRIAPGEVQTPGLEGGFQHAVGDGGVDADPEAVQPGKGRFRRRWRARRQGSVFQPDGFLRVRKLAGGIGGRGCQQGGAGARQPQHAAGIVAVHPDRESAFFHQNAETLVALPEPAHNAGGRQRKERERSGHDGTRG